MRQNPVLQRELRERMRGPRAVIILTGYLGLLVGIFYYVYHAQAGGRTGVDITIAPTEVAQIGRGIFEWVLFFMMLLVLFMVPGLTSGAIAGERERQTLVPMQVTLLTPRSIVIGKVMASLAFLFLLIVASLPLFALSYLIGGISLTQAMSGLAVVCLTGVAYACITVACSAMVRRVQTATVLAYGVVLVTVMGTFLVFTAAGLVDGDSSGSSSASNHPPAVILVTNPMALTAAVIARDADQVDTGGKTNSPFEPIRNMVEPLRRDGATPSDGDGTTPGTTSTTTPTRTTRRSSSSDAFPGSSTSTTTTAVAAADSTGGGSDASFAPFISAGLVLMIGFALASIWVSTIRLRIPAEVER